MEPQRAKQLYEVIGQLYVEGYNGTQMLNHLQQLIVTKDEKIKELEGKILDFSKDNKADGNTSES